MYEIAKVAPVFGSRRDEYTPESIVAIHDGCGVAMPHAYDAGPDEEVNEFLRARRHGRRRRADQPAGEDRRRRGHPGAVEAEAQRATRSASSTATTTSASRPRRSAIDGDAGHRRPRRLRRRSRSGAKQHRASPATARSSRATLTLATVGGIVPATLALTLGAPASFGAFMPGVAKTYTATTTATVVSARATRADVTDPSATARPPRQRRLRPAAAARAASARSRPRRPDQQRRRDASRSRRRIDAGDALRTGAYAKTLTFTLSTTAP